MPVVCTEPEEIWSPLLDPRGPSEYISFPACHQSGPQGGSVSLLQQKHGQTLVTVAVISCCWLSVTRFWIIFAVV